MPTPIAVYRIFHYKILILKWLKADNLYLIIEATLLKILTIEIFTNHTEICDIHEVHTNPSYSIYNKYLHYYSSDLIFQWYIF